MISADKLNAFKGWLKNYVETFYKSDEKNKNVYQIKYEHSLRVCKEIIDIGSHCDMPESQLRLAELIALFHDLGRFEQFHKYSTFSDVKSVNHAFLAIKILKEHRLFAGFDEDLINLIYTAIENHNIRTIPHDVIGDGLFFSKLLRDADKIDIFKVVTDYYVNKTFRNEAIELDLPDLPEILEDNYLDVESGRLIKKENLRTLNDFKLMQISWLFDVNFERTFEIIKERSYLDKIFAVLPKNNKIENVKKFVFAYLQNVNVNQ